MQTADLIKKFGDIKKLTCPSGFHVMIREQNGDDDGILSNVSLNKEATAINTFIEDVVIWAEHGKTPEQRLTAEQVMEMRLKDKYYILMNSRIFSLGDKMSFEYDWGGDTGFVTYEEDLAKFVWDFDMPFPEPDAPNYPIDAIEAYPESIDVTHTERVLTTGKRVRFKYLDGYGEQMLFKLPDYKIDVNARLKARDLQLDVEGTWMKVESFKPFKSREMVELRQMVEEVDKQFDGVVEIVNPDTNDKVNQFLIRIPDFFYPRGI